MNALTDICNDIIRLGEKHERLKRRQMIGQRLLNEAYNASGRDVNTMAWPTEADIDAAIAAEDAIDARIDVADGEPTALERKAERANHGGN